MSTTLKYRPDLDGIRALAVLAVIIFHIDAAWLPGGFLGVDMFFVLSGYLITTIISREMQNGSFSFLEFYKRRAKRILPVFACVLLCTSLAAAIFFLSFDLRQYVKSAVFALLFSANLFLHGAAVILMPMRRKNLCNTFGLYRWKSSFTLFSQFC